MSNSNGSYFIVAVIYLLALIGFLAVVIALAQRFLVPAICG